MGWFWTFLRSERGDIIQNLGWLVAVSIGGLALGGLVYAGMKGYATNVKTKVESQTITPPTVTY